MVVGFSVVVVVLRGGAVAAAMSARAKSARGQAVAGEPRGVVRVWHVRSSASLSSEREYQGTQLQSAQYILSERFQEKNDPRSFFFAIPRPPW